MYDLLFVNLYYSTLAVLGSGRSVVATTTTTTTTTSTTTIIGDRSVYYFAFPFTHFAFFTQISMRTQPQKSIFFKTESRPLNLPPSEYLILTHF